MSGWVGAAVLGTVLYRRRWLRLDAVARRRLPRICLATIAMGAAVGYANHRWLAPAGGASSVGRLAILAALVTLGIVIYVAALQVLGVVKLKEIAAALRTRT